MHSYQEQNALRRDYNSPELHKHAGGKGREEAHVWEGLVLGKCFIWNET